MPADDDYGRRQITIQQPQPQPQHGSPSPVPVQCPAGCVPPPTDHRLQQQQQQQQEARYASEKSLLEAPERFIASERFSDRVGTDRFGSERSNSDRLPSGERYQGVSERFPLGERPQTSVSSERLLPKEILQSAAMCQSDKTNDRYHYTERTSCQRYPERYTPVQNVGSLDRYHTHATLDRYSRTNTPTDRYHTLSSDKDRCGGNTDRYTPTDKYHTGAIDSFSSTDRHSSAQSVCSIERYTPTERHRSGSKSDIYKIRERSASSDRKAERYQQYQNHYPLEQYDGRFSSERFPPIPCPERFATQERNERPERIQYAQQVSYMEPPSPAPASDRFIPPPPLSPENTPSPDCYPNNAFPSPTTTVPIPDRFIPPPPLSPSPTETFSPKKLERYDKSQRFQDRYTSSPNNSNDRYHIHDRKYYDRYQNGSSHQNNLHSHVSNSDKYGGERYIPPNAHTPVERYVPQQQEPYYQQYQNYDRYTNKFTNSSDPYMRRDLPYHYRLPLPYNPNQYQRIRYMGTPNRVKCCQFPDGYQLSKSSPGSSSSSSVTSQGKELHQKEVQCVNNLSLQDMQCQNYQGKEYQCGYQQEKGTQCGALPCQPNGTIVSPNLRNAKGQCRHSICASPSVEYVGGAGGRHVCATPPPRGSIGSGDGSMCSENCCTRRSQPSMPVTVWRTTPPQSQHVPPQQQQQQPQQQPIEQQHPQQQQQPHVATTIQPQQAAARAATPVATANGAGTVVPSEGSQQEQQSPAPRQEQEMKPISAPQATKQQTHTQTSPPQQRGVTYQRAVSLPAASVIERPRPQRQVGYSQSERIPNRQRPLNRSASKKEVIKKYIKKETANFFGVDEENEEENRERWLERRKRMACRTMGPLKEEYMSTMGRNHRRAYSENIGLSATSGQLVAERPDVLPGPSGDIPDGQDRLGNGVTVRRKDSVARMTLDGLSYVVTTLTRNRPRPRSQQAQWSRSYPPESPSSPPSSPEEQSFFDRRSTGTLPKTPEISDTVDRGRELGVSQNYRENYTRPPGGGWRREHPDVELRHGDHRQGVGGSRIFSNFLDHVLDNSDRRQFGMGWVGKMFGRSMRKSVANERHIQEQLDDLEDHRPMFTYWVTTVQILVLFISIICYGFGPFGINLQARSGQVLVPSLSLQQVDYLEPANFWGGPRAGDLIHLGAKFAPCMRVDDKVTQEIEKLRTKERDTACCIRNDDSGCVQSSQSECSVRGLRPAKWTASESGPGGRMSGSVCGLDPKFCDSPPSVAPYEWPDDITKWPICRKANTQFSTQKRPKKDPQAEHMVCEVIGHPCCIGIHGKCKITTKEYCDFVKGTFHEEASLCSQVSCLNDVCGMLPFYFPDVPDQFYRLWTSLFMHAGILQLAITVLIQWFLMRDLEKLTGSLRIAIIYICSGVGGNLASAIFVPYRADVGPAGSQFGLLACLIVEVLKAWPMLKHPRQALWKLVSLTMFLFAIGLLPWVDNYAHLFGFIFGFLISYALMPFVTFGSYDRQKKIVLIWVCLLSAGILFIVLVLLFYIIPVYDCKLCSYFNCIPFTRDFCASQNINFKREEPVV
ncbi:uncharacterized protein LOC109608827 isoform X3 [Aethina tumida]|uniref:uncharacterized protein LOC109608827 isoform X3 n=1 Tax=Aethina tumida TaxID=116153 RepID=UPI002149715C|nr:uncharacterized protein LOC109608827 isoform X3 [Aethina tumida]